MTKKAIHKLQFIIDKASKILLEIEEENMSVKSSPEKWSKKEILGHLIDSATNNHHRLVRGQFDSEPEISYDQNQWNTFSFHQDIKSKQLIDFWTIYNKQLIEIIKRIPVKNLEKQIRIDENLITIEVLIIDYVEHLEHHLKQIIKY